MSSPGLPGGVFSLPRCAQLGHLLLKGRARFRAHSLRDIHQTVSNPHEVPASLSSISKVPPRSMLMNGRPERVEERKDAVRQVRVGAHGARCDIVGKLRSAFRAAHADRRVRSSPLP